MVRTGHDPTTVVEIAGSLGWRGSRLSGGAAGWWRRARADIDGIEHGLVFQSALLWVPRSPSWSGSESMGLAGGFFFSFISFTIPYWSSYFVISFLFSCKDWRVVMDLNGLCEGKRCSMTEGLILVSLP
ncbi:hypothetical protein M0R45_005304 [Rubus argutus]|uniref:Uncharacterized protein n=1 Tax=Rubus argutus TaxID=59490 RepID=A0AAW1YMS3_RUBAR